MRSSFIMLGLLAFIIIPYSASLCRQTSSVSQNRGKGALYLERRKTWLDSFLLVVLHMIGEPSCNFLFE